MMVMATWSSAGRLDARLLCITKLPFKKNGGRSGRKDTELACAGVLLACSPGRVADQPLQHGEIVEKAAAADFCKPTAGMRPVALVALGYFDQSSFLQHLKMAAEVAVVQPAELLEGCQGASLGMGHQRGQ